MKNLGLVVCVLAVIIAILSGYDGNVSALNGWICTAIWSFSHYWEVKDK